MDACISIHWSDELMDYVVATPSKGYFSIHDLRTALTCLTNYRLGMDTLNELTELGEELGDYESS